MGAAVARAVRNFNLENRAEREISRMKPSPAPRHPSTKNLLREQMSSECCPGASGPGARAPRAGWVVGLGAVEGWPGSAAVTRVSRTREGGATGLVTLSLSPCSRGACGSAYSVVLGVSASAHADPALLGFNALRPDIRNENQKESFAGELSRRLRRTVDTELDLASWVTFKTRPIVSSECWLSKK